MLYNYYNTRRGAILKSFTSIQCNLAKPALLGTSGKLRFRRVAGFLSIRCVYIFSYHAIRPKYTLYLNNRRPALYY